MTLKPVPVATVALLLIVISALWFLYSSRTVTAAEEQAVILELKLAPAAMGRLFKTAHLASENPKK
jgi:hypothetical protein